MFGFGKKMMKREDGETLVNSLSTFLLLKEKGVFVESNYVDSIYYGLISTVPSIVKTDMKKIDFQTWERAFVSFVRLEMLIEMLLKVTEGKRATLFVDWGLETHISAKIIERESNDINISMLSYEKTEEKVRRELEASMRESFQETNMTNDMTFDKEELSSMYRSLTKEDPFEKMKNSIKKDVGELYGLMAFYMKIVEQLGIDEIGPILRKNENISKVVLADLMYFAVWIITIDGDIHTREIELVNSALPIKESGSLLTQEMVEATFSEGRDTFEHFTDYKPRGFILLCLMDQAAKNVDLVDEKDYYLGCRIYYRIVKNLGAALIASDRVIDIPEIENHAKYMQNLEDIFKEETGLVFENSPQKATVQKPNNSDVDDLCALDETNGGYIKTCVNYANKLYEKYGKEGTTDKEFFFANVVVFAEQVMDIGCLGFNRSDEFKLFIDENIEAIGTLLGKEPRAVREMYSAAIRHHNMLNIHAMLLKNEMARLYVSGLLDLGSTIDNDSIDYVLRLLHELREDIHDLSIPKEFRERMVSLDVPSDSEIKTAYYGIRDKI